MKAMKGIFRLLPFWACNVFVASAMVQRSTFFVLQGDTMDNHMWGSIKLPAASMALFSLVVVVMGAPVYTMLVERRNRRTRREILYIARMGAGLAVSIATFGVAAVVEGQRLRAARSRNDSGEVPMSIFWLAPQYMLEGMTTVLFGCGNMEFNYMYAPQGVRGLATAMSISGFAIGNYLSSFLVDLVTAVTPWISDDLNEGHLDYFYWLLAGLLLITLFFFMASSRWVLSVSEIRHSHDEESLLYKSGLQNRS